MDTVMHSFHELLGFGELFDDQKFTSQRAPDIYPSSLLDSEFDLLEDLFASVGAGGCPTKPIEEDEDVDVETVDDNTCATIRETLSTNYETSKATSKVPPDEEIPPSLFNLESFGKFDCFADDYLSGTCGIEADDLDSLFQQFDNVSKALDSRLAVASRAASPLQEFSEGETACHSLLDSTWDCLVDLTLAPAADVSSKPEAAPNCISGPLPLSVDYFDKISDHMYCLTQRADVDIKHEPSEFVGSSVAADTEVAAARCLQHEDPSTRPVDSGLAGGIMIVVGTTAQQGVRCDAKTVNAAHQGIHLGAKTGRAKSLLRPNAPVKQAPTTLSNNTLQAAIYSASIARSGSSCPSVSRPSCVVSTRKAGALSSTATTSQSSSSDSGSDCEQSGSQRRQSRARCRSNSRSCSSREQRRYRSRSSSSSSHSSRSRSRSRSSHSSRQRHEREKQEDKHRAMAERRVVYVGNIPSNFTKADLRRRFSGFGEIEDVSVHFRDHGDNYGFVTFADSCDAYAAIEKGNDVPGKQFKLCFGGRRIFCETEYADLDGCAAVKEEWALRSCRRRDDFESLLKQTMRRIKKK